MSPPGAAGDSKATPEATAEAESESEEADRNRQQGNDQVFHARVNRETERWLIGYPEREGRGRQGPSR
jgi:hypothetical protein